MRYALTVSTDLPYPPEAVYDFVLDMRNDPRWAPLVRQVTLVQGEPGPGAVFRCEQWVGPGRYRELDIRVTEAERPRRIRWACDDRVMRYRAEMRFEPTDTGTRLTQSNTNELVGSRAPAWFVQLMAEITLRRQFRRLKRALRTARQ